MIRLRQVIERALGHRWFGPVILVLLVVLLAFVALHTMIDAAHHEIALACLAIAAVVIRLLVRPGGAINPPKPPKSSRRRGPPASSVAVPALIVRAAPSPLRL